MSDDVTKRGSVGEVFGAFLKLGVTSFGGPVAHLGYFRKELVERRGWVSEGQYGQLLAICQFLPGPASSQLGFALGLLRAGWGGALAAFAAFTMPSVFLLVAFAALLPHLSSPAGEAAIHGLKLVACAVVADALRGMASKLCPDVPRRGIAIAAAALLLVFASAWSQILVVLMGAVAGIVLLKEKQDMTEMPFVLGYGKKTGLSFLILFLVLLFGLSFAALSPAGLLALAEAFYRAGALVFGGGHVVLPLLEDAIVGKGWVNKENFLAGYGASQAIPGPMFSFSAYLGALVPTEHSPYLSAAVALGFMFLPGFLLICAALPLWQSLTSRPGTSGAVSGINAAVVGLLAAALYDPIFTTSVRSGIDMAIAIVAFGLLAVWQRSPLIVVVWCVAASLVATTI